jgi:hypothetical protein
MSVYPSPARKIGGCGSALYRETGIRIRRQSKPVKKNGEKNTHDGTYVAERTGKGSDAFIRPAGRTEADQIEEQMGLFVRELCRTPAESRFPARLAPSRPHARPSFWLVADH